MFYRELIILAHSIIIGVALYLFMRLAMRQHPVLHHNRSICIAGALILYELFIYLS